MDLITKTVSARSKMRLDRSVYIVVRKCCGVSGMSTIL